MIDITRYYDIDEEVLITFTDDTSVIGRIESIDDEEESDIGELGISFYTKDGGYIEIGQSEVKNIDVLRTEDNEGL